MTWLIKRNCSASPSQLALVFGSLVALSLAFGAIFAVLGFWMVLPFVGLEIAAVAVAFFCYGRHAADCERISLEDDVLAVERNEADRLRRWVFDTAWVRVDVQDQGRGLGRTVQVHLSERGERLEVGRYLPDERREQFAQELMAALSAMRNAARTTERHGGDRRTANEQNL